MMLAIFMGAVYGFLIVVMLIGPERLNHDLIMTDRQETERFKRKDAEAEAENAESVSA